MAELTKLEAKLGEVTGLAMAAQAATKKVGTLAKEEHPELVARLERMHEEAAETERRCTELADDWTARRPPSSKRRGRRRAKGAEMMATYLDDDADALDGFEFLTMAEAGEVGHWSVLKKLNEKKGSAGVRRARGVGAAHSAGPPEGRHGDVTRAGSRRGPGRRSVSGPDDDPPH